MNRYPILEVCARVEGHAVQHQMLRDYCREFQDWQGLLERAEREGMSPLLRKHLIESGSDFPASVRRSLNILYKRHQKLAEGRLEVLEELLILFNQHQLTPMLIKGAALCQTLYQDPALRPMRDIDLLFSREEVDQAQELMRNVGFIQSTAPLSPDHYHLPSLHKSVDEVKVCLELHRGLYPDCPPYYPEVNFAHLVETGETLKIGDTSVLTFCHEEMIHYLYQHGFRAPLTYETYRLIHAADVISFIEKYVQEIDWKHIRKIFPQLYRALPLMQHISPWNFDKIPENFISTRSRKHQLQPLPFNGWPQRRVKELKKKVSLGELLKTTFLPPGWWLRMYYGAGYSLWRFLKVVSIDHIKNVFWWTHFYAHFDIETPECSSKDAANKVSGLNQFFIPTRNKVLALYRKIRSL